MERGRHDALLVQPGRPADVVVLRGFGGAYLFALFPMPVFWIGLAARASVSRG